MTNPCSQCIVKAMCIEPCYMLTTYLKKNLPVKYGHWPERVAERFVNRECSFIYLGNTILKVIYHDD